MSDQNLRHLTHTWHLVKGITGGKLSHMAYVRLVFLQNV